MYLFALFNSDSVKQNRQKYLTLKICGKQFKCKHNSTNNNIHTCIFYNPTPKPTHHSKLSAFLHFQSLCMIYKLVGDLKNIPIRLEFTGITILVGTFGPHNVGNTSTQTHSLWICILFSMIELLLYTVHSNLKGVSTVPTLPPCIFLKMLYNPFNIHVRKYVH